MITKFKERKYVPAPEDWLISPISDMKVTYRIIDNSERKKFNTSLEVYDFMLPAWPDIDHYESMFALYLNRANQMIGCNKISSGSINGTLVDPKIVIQPALLVNASCIILVHNHPSGNIIPSSSDISITKKMKEACKVHDIDLVDHMIITRNSYYSFLDMGTL